MENQQDNPKTESRQSGIGPGERLQAARIQQSLSIDDVASRMHLSVNILKSIENNNFEEITAPIFVKGYLRAYARIVSLDEEELIQQYGEYYSHEDPPISTTSNMAPELSVADVRIKWMTYLVILGLAALLAFWWWNKKQGDVMPISLDSQSGEQQIVQSDGMNTGDGMEAGTADTGAAEQAPTDSASAGLEPTPPTEPEAAEPQAAAAEPETAAAEPENAEPQAAGPAVTEPLASAEADNESTAAGEAAAAETQSPAGEAETTAANEETPQAEPAAEEEQPTRLRSASPILVAPTGSDKLLLTITADTWADIKDSTGFQMVYHLLRADQSFELTGSAPFSVFLGNGRGAEIKFNGEAIDFTGKIRSDNTTRLKIGG
ncbi:MAG: DUF4115 domain-containing protein [Gammaproteobacteria bacterium]|jgi:cytoskeleton protein RodZ